MLGCMFTLQICVFITFYQTALPANTAVYIEHFRDLIEFNALKPDNLLKLVNNKYSIAFFKGLGQQKLLNTMESTGITNTDSVNNL